MPLSRGAYRLLQALRAYARKKDTCFPSHRTLADRLRCSERSVRRWLAELLDGGLITAQRRPNISSIYTINPPKSDGRSETMSKSPVILQMQLTLSGPKNENVRSGVRSGVRSLPYITEKALNKGKSTASKQGGTQVEIPSYYTTEEEQRLYRMALRWAKENGVDLHPLEIGIVMTELEKLGALEARADEKLPELAWRPSRPQKIQPASDSQRKPMAIANLPETLQLRKAIGKADS